MFVIAFGYEEAEDCDALHTDPLFKLAVGRAPESGRALCSQPTMSRLEHAPSRSEPQSPTIGKNLSISAAVTAWPARPTR